MTGVIAIKGPGVGVGTLPGLQGVGHGLQCKAEGQETLTIKTGLIYVLSDDDVYGINQIKWRPDRCIFTRQCPMTLLLRSQVVFLRAGSSPSSLCPVSHVPFFCCVPQPSPPPPLPTHALPDEPHIGRIPDGLVMMHCLLHSGAASVAVSFLRQLAQQASGPHSEKLRIGLRLQHLQAQAAWTRVSGAGVMGGWGRGWGGRVGRVGGAGYPLDNYFASLSDMFVAPRRAFYISCCTSHGCRLPLAVLPWLRRGARPRSPLMTLPLELRLPDLQSAGKQPGLGSSLGPRTRRPRSQQLVRASHQ